MKGKEINNKVKRINESLSEVSKASKEKIKKLKQYEHLFVAAIAFFVIISGLSASIIERSSMVSPTGFVVIDTTSKEISEVPMLSGEESCAEEWFCTEWSECSREGIMERECLDFNSCKTSCSKPAEAMECKPAYLAWEHPLIEDKIEEIETSITGFAASAVRSITSDILLVLVYLIAVASLGIIAFYAYMAYVHRTAPHHSVAAAAYWLAMAGVPLSIYFTITRDQYLIPAYIAFGIVIAAFAALMHLKPWEIKEGLPELEHVDRLLSFVSENSGKSIRKIRDGRRDRQKSFEFFREKLHEWRRENEMRMIGAKDVKLEDVDRDIRKIMEKSPEITKDILEIENNVKTREEKFLRMNKQLSRWADERRSKRAEEEHRKRQEKLAKKARKQKEGSRKSKEKGSEER